MFQFRSVNFTVTKWVLTVYNQKIIQVFLYTMEPTNSGWVSVYSKQKSSFSVRQ